MRAKQTKVYPQYGDPEGSFIKVSMEEIRLLNLEDKISHYSYIKDGYVFLENKHDAPLFMKTKPIEIRLKTSMTKRYSKIRSYEPYTNR